MISFMACKNEIEIILIKYIHSMESIFYGITLEQNEINFCQQNLIYNKKNSNGFEQIVSAIKIVQTQQTIWIVVSFDFSRGSGEVYQWLGLLGGHW